MKASTDRYVHKDKIVRPILVAGLPRSGTTWVARILTYLPWTRYIHEPDNEHNNLLAYLYKQDQPRYPFLTADDTRNSYYGIYKNAFSGRYWYAYSRIVRMFKKTLRFDYDYAENHIQRKQLHLYNGGQAKARNGTEPYRAKTIKIFWNLFNTLNPIRHSHRILVKSVHASLALPFLYQHFSPHIVYLYRHPANLVASYKKLDLNDRWRDIFENKRLLENYLSPFLYEVKKLEHPLARAAAQIGAIYYVVEQQKINYPQWIMVKHETLCSSPIKEFKKLNRKLELPWTKGIKSYIDELNREGEGFSTYRKAHKQIDKWKRKLDKREIEAVRRGYSIFPLSIYSNFTKA